MAIIDALGASFDEYGVDGEDLGWAHAHFTPRELAANPHGLVQAGVHVVLLDAVINFAVNAALSGRDRTSATVEISTELMRPATQGENYDVRGEVVRLTRQVAYAEGTIVDESGRMMSHATGTFLLHRDASTDEGD